MKDKIEDYLRAEDFSLKLDRWRRLPGRRIISPLLSFLYHREEIVRWHAVTAIGVVVSELARTDMESSRVLMRRLMWNLNDESGTMPWGTPEAMGEIMAQSEELAAEYSHLLVSYVCTEENSLENLFLQRGVLWGLGRLAQSRSDYLRNISSCLVRFLESEDNYLRGLSVRVLSFLDPPADDPRWLAVKKDDTIIKIYSEMRFTSYRIRDLARCGYAGSS